MTADTIEARPGSAVCDPEGQLQIARQHRFGWAVIAKTAFWNDDPFDADEGPVVLFVGLQSEAAARVAVDSAKKSCRDERFQNPLPFDCPSDDPTERFNAVGRILSVLEEEVRISDLSKHDWLYIAKRAYYAALDQQVPLSEDVV